MVSKKLKILTALTILLLYLHAYEEAVTGFPQSDVFFIWIGNAFLNQTTEAYWVSHIIWFVLLAISFLLILGGKWTLRILSIFSLVFIVELHHVIKAIIYQKLYYPGMFTALLFPILGIFYWRELIINWRKNYGRS